MLNFDNSTPHYQAAQRKKNHLTIENHHQITVSHFGNAIHDNGDQVLFSAKPRLPLKTSLASTLGKRKINETALKPSGPGTVWKSIEKPDPILRRSKRGKTDSPLINRLSSSPPPPPEKEKTPTPVFEGEDLLLTNGNIPGAGRIREGLRGSRSGTEIIDRSRASTVDSTPSQTPEPNNGRMHLYTPTNPKLL